MNNAHFHLVLNHLPVVGVLIGFLVLLSGFLLKKAQVKATSLGIFVFSALTSIAAFLSGEAAAETVKDISGISETLVHNHEEYAALFFALTLILGILSLWTAFFQFRRSKYTGYLYIAILILAVADSIAAKYAGTSGGEIRHPELRRNATIIQLKQRHDD